MSGRLVDEHLAGLHDTLAGVRAESDRVEAWGRELAARLRRGQRLLAAGNGGSAAEAQHLTAELVGRYRREREPLSAIALHAETSTLTAVGNDYGFAEVYARQVRAHGRPGDLLVLLSTSGASENLLAAAEAARTLGVTVWALTGPAPNPLAALGDDALCLPGAAPSVQEAQLVAVHLLCEVVDRELTRGSPSAGAGRERRGPREVSTTAARAPGPEGRSSREVPVSDDGTVAGGDGSRANGRPLLRRTDGATVAPSYGRGDAEGDGELVR